MLEVVPLGGLGEFGMNMLALTWGETTIVVDAGVMFPDPELLGVDRIIPELTYLQQNRRVAALVLTHGHEDHIGAVPHVVPLVNGPVYATPLTLALVEPKLEEHGIQGRSLVRVRPRDRVTIGPFEVEFIRVTHSMPDCVALAIRTPAGIVVHTGDFKIDQTPIDGEHFDVHRFAQLGAEGVLALFADSTNIDRRGFTGSEREVVEAFEEIFSSATGKLIVAAFASSIYRMQILVDLAAQFDRKVAFVGRGMIENSQIAQRLGYLSIPSGVQIRDSDVPAYPSQDVLCLATGSQGEPQAALSRTAINDHRFIKVTDDDTVVISARAIPGNEKAIGRVINHLARRGADVIHEGIKHVHVSGHGSDEELKLMLSLVRPRYFVPVHGEYRQLSQHARVANRVFAGRDPRPEILLVENGDVLHFDERGARIAGKAPVGRVLIDDTRTGEVGDEVLRDRRHLAEEGLVVPVVAINKQTGTLEGIPDIIARGFVMEDSEALLADALIWIISLASYEPSDPVWFFSTGAHTAPANFAGRVGAFLAELSFQLFGYGSYVIPAVFVIVGWNYFWCRSLDAAATKATGAALLIGCCSTFVSLVLGTLEVSGKPFRAGGYAGEFVAKEMADYLNRTGSVIVILTLTFLALIMSTQFSFGRFFGAILRALKNTAVGAFDSFREWREERRREKQRRDVIAKHTKKGTPLPAFATAPTARPEVNSPPKKREIAAEDTGDEADDAQNQALAGLRSTPAATRPKPDAPRAEAPKPKVAV